MVEGIRRDMNKHRRCIDVFVLVIMLLLAGCGESKNSLNQTAVGGHIDFDKL